MTEPNNPIEKFIAEFARANRSESHDATACTLATANPASRPSARVVLLKDVDDRGFVFFTNFRSRKARELAENPHAALCFHWPTIDLQVRVEGIVEKASEEESDTYFASRPRQSQLGAWASHQSEPLESRRQLLARYLKYKARFVGAEVPRPEHWGGFRLTPKRIEFWYMQLHRMHDRQLFSRVGEQWSMERLNP